MRGGQGILVLHRSRLRKTAFLVRVEEELEIRSDGHIPQIGLGVEVIHGTERRQGEIHPFARALPAEHAAAMDVIRFHQFAADPLFGVKGRKFTGLEPVGGQVLVRSVGTNGNFRVRLTGRREFCRLRDKSGFRALCRKKRDQKREDKGRPRSHPITSDTGPRLSTKRSAFTSIFCIMVSMTLLKRAFSSRGLPQRSRHSS